MRCCRGMWISGSAASTATRSWPTCRGRGRFLLDEREDLASHVDLVAHLRQRLEDAGGNELLDVLLRGGVGDTEVACGRSDRHGGRMGEGGGHPAENSGVARRGAPHARIPSQ